MEQNVAEVNLLNGEEQKDVEVNTCVHASRQQQTENYYTILHHNDMGI